MDYELLILGEVLRHDRFTNSYHNTIIPKLIMRLHLRKLLPPQMNRLAGGWVCLDFAFARIVVAFVPTTRSKRPDDSQNHLGFLVRECHINRVRVGPPSSSILQSSSYITSTSTRVAPAA